MNEFKLLAKRDSWIIVNHFLEIKNNPKRLGIYLLYLVWIGSLVFNVVIRYRNPATIQAQLGSQIIGAGFVGLGAAFLLYFCIVARWNLPPFYHGGCTSVISHPRFP